MFLDMDFVSDLKNWGNADMSMLFSHLPQDLAATGQLRTKLSTLCYVLSVKVGITWIMQEYFFCMCMFVFLPTWSNPFYLKLAIHSLTFKLLN